ncbi:hypothetical protein EDC19_1023 [Natranaerovirga hydrolytica]|uniref:DUF4878 domain-containing protein n=2 Tax=Natranaerovirga hydrolytica TaxID=680378 RepID=A0A4V6NFI8_9FIRM|nr:hypothetical protein EDC19_1023 [Natranaerovirga hydrolytica]
MLNKKMSKISISVLLISLLLFSGCTTNEDTNFSLTEEELNSTPAIAVQQMIAGILDMDSEMYLSSYSEQAVTEIITDFDSEGYADDYEDYTDWFEETVLPILNDDLTSAGFTKVSDYTIVNPEGYEDEDEIDLEITFDGGTGLIPVIKIDDKWYIRDLGLYD